MTALVVEHSLGLAQLQDAGRFGVRHLGLTQGGALDWVSMRWANWLVGNSPAACVVEIPLGGLTLRSETATSLAVCGADLAAQLDDLPLPLWQSVSIGSGQRLTFNPPQQGVRAYLAVPGGFAAPFVMGSRATVTRESLGGLDGYGQPLRSGDRLLFTAQQVAPRRVQPELRNSTLPPATSPLILDMLLGAQHRSFSGRTLFAAFNDEWQVDARSDRMGVRLAGPILAYAGEGLVSEGIPLGAIQVPPDGQPIILLNDRQTIGGYPKLGALTPFACASLAQCATGTRLRLRPVATEQARQQTLALLERTAR